MDWTSTHISLVRRLCSLILLVSLLPSGCVKRRVTEKQDEEPQVEVASTETSAPGGARKGPPPRGNVGGQALPVGGLPRTSPALAKALLAYLDGKDAAKLKPLWDYASREVQPADLKDHQHLLCTTMVAAARLLVGEQAEYITREQEVVVTYLVPRSGDRKRLREMLMTVLHRPLPRGAPSTVYRQLVDGHLSFSFGLRKLLAASKLLTIPPGAVVADVGCGVGTQALELARAVGPRGKVLAVDIDPGVITFLRHLKSAVPEGGRIKPVRSVSEDVGLQKGTVDLAMIHGINFLFAVEGAHVPHHAFKLMRSIHRAIKEGGHLLVRSYQKTDRLITYLARCGFKEVGDYDARGHAVTGPTGSHKVDRLVLFQRVRPSPARPAGPIP